MSSPETILNGLESGATGQESRDSDPTTSTRTQRRSRKRTRLSSSSPTPNEESDTGDANTEATRPERNISRMAIEDDLIHTERAIPNKPLLSNLEKHPSANAKAGKSISTKNLNFRGAWPTAVQLYREAHDKYKDLFRAAGFEDFLTIDTVHIPQAYALALTERWFSETNTVHLPSFEIGPTPVDWTMITGLRFGGQCITLDPNYDQSKALELLGANPKAISEGKICLSVIRPTIEEVKANPENNKTKQIIFRRLFLYVIGSCFFSNNRSMINRGFVKIVERIDALSHYDWGAMTYAAFLTGMRRKVTAESGAFSGFWPFLVFWAFEYLDISRPGHAVDDVAVDDVFPRARRWNCPRNHPGPLDLAEVIRFRCQLNYIEEDQMTWQPYSTSVKFGSGSIDSEIDLSKKRVPFMSLDTWEYYLGERCRRQFGLPCRVPHPPPVNMHGTSAVEPEDPIGFGRYAESLVMDETEKYDRWFAENSIGKIVDVNEMLGGSKIARKVVQDWMAKHLSESECDEIIAARKAAVPACDTAVPARDANIAECSDNQENSRATSDS